ncbi:uncharacterized protein LOC112596109 [Melanaphis sacchari]|uniref:uncharacterized protein LOC112596109 n=1 Tax=Melanaphis sacchari TaxID=742174 RepID=UPI000DC1320D|nr:uncharacterized protein LOC112596109 [Melanaphis sacchari]
MSDNDSNTLEQNDDNNENYISQQIYETPDFDQNVSQNPNDLPNTTPQSSDVISQRRTSLHPLEEVELNRRIKRKRTSSAHIAQPLSTDENNNEDNQSQRLPQQPIADNKNTLNIRMSSLSFEGYSSVTSDDSRYLDSRRANEKWKALIVFMYTEPSIMFYSNVFLMIFSIILMKTSDKFISNLDITRTFLNLESNKTIFLCLYSGFLMILSCICALYSALTIRKQLCYCISGVMIISAIFQLGLGIIIINRKIDQETMVKKEMKLSFLSYDIQLDVTQRWNSFQSEFSCCGLYGGNSYKAKHLAIPVSCFKDQSTFKYHAEINNCHMGCFELVKKLEEKFLDPVIILTFFCSFLQMSNAILILNLLRPKPKPRRYHIVYRRTFNIF